MMRKRLSLLLALVMSLTLLLSSTAIAEEPIKLLMLTGSENDPYFAFTYQQIREFNEAMKGKYVIETEFAGAQSADRLEKMKVLNASNALPAIVTQLQEDVGFAQTLAANGRLLDILPYYQASPEWQEYQLDGCVQSSINLSGGDKLYFVPNTTDSYIGFFYNKELLKKAGYDSFPEDSWEDFWKMCDDLKAVGITPIAMDTLESAWCSMLTCTSVLGDSPEGIEFLTQLFPTDFENEHMVRVFETLKRIFDNYTTGDAAGAPYAVAANNFCSGQVAIIANGPWMIESMYDPSYAPEGFAEKVGYATFPGHVMIVENDLIGAEAISMDVSKEEQEAAIEWYKFRASKDQITKETLAKGRFNPKVPIDPELIKERGSIYVEYANAISRVKTSLPCYQTRWDGVTMYEVFAVELPNYVSGAITTEELLKKMSESATKYVQDLEASKQ